jgi:hypothetical protein
MLRRAALAAAGTAAAEAMALGPTGPSAAAAIPIIIITTTNQAGNSAWNFRYVQAVSP